MSTSSTIPSRSGVRAALRVLTALVILAGVALMLRHRALERARHFRPSTAQPASPASEAPPHSREDFAAPVLARDQCRKLANAIRSFRGKNGLAALTGGPVESEEEAAFPVNDAMLDALTGRDRARNAAGVNYLKASGLATPIPSGCFFAAFDLDGDGRIPDPSSPGDKVEQDILVWHSGEDGDASTWEDNAHAWMKPAGSTL